MKRQSRKVRWLARQAVLDARPHGHGVDEICDSALDPTVPQISKVNQLRILLQTVTISPPWASIASNGILRVSPGPDEINIVI